MKALNHLAGETSPYLRQHAGNPVDWYPWGEEAFAKAKAEDKPIFLSIGYSACHWCHVMERESFENAETAELLNRSFVSVKVDREERPDIDSVYMTACQVMTGSGGWPLSVFLTPEGRPFFAGTYFPKDSGYGVPGFGELLKAVETAWSEERETLTASAETITKRLDLSQRNTAAGQDLIGKAVKEFSRSFDAQFGGFGNAPKFPTPHICFFLLREYEKHGDKGTLDMAETTLAKMYEGGLFDHIGGGFCRYSTDRSFLVPHFEKMLYDNALLIIAYSKAYEITRKDLYLYAAESTAQYLLREMRSEDGGFSSSQDADSEGTEGLYYLFRPEEVVAVLGEKEGAEFNARFDITPEGNFEGMSIPNLLKSGGDAEDLEEQKRKLLEYRRQRTALLKDDKQLAFWNALAASAFCTLYRVCGKREYLETAKETHRFIETVLTVDGALHTSVCKGKPGSRAFLDDHAGLALCRIALYEATLESAYLDKAVESAKTAAELYFDRAAGGFFFSGTENESLIVKTKETYDGAIPSGNSIMTYVLARLSVLAEDAGLESVLEKQLAYMKAEASSYPAGYAMFLTALSDIAEPPARVTAVGAVDEKEGIPLSVPIGANITFLESETADYKLLNGRPTYYVCRAGSCSAPANELKFGREI